MVVPPIPTFLPTHRGAREQRLCAEDAEIACWDAALRAPSVRVRSSLGLRAHTNAWGTALVCAGADHMFFNRIYLRPPEGHGGLGDLAELLRLHRSEGVTRFFVHVDSDWEPRVQSLLVDAGLVRYPRSWVKLQAPLEPPDGAPQPPGVASHGSIRPLEAREAPRFAELFRGGFDLPESLDPVFQALVGTEGFETLGAFVDGRLSAVGLAYYHGDNAYLAGGVTAPEHRKRGLQGALVGARRRAAVARGCSEWCSETGEERPGQPQHSERNLQRHGLRRIACRHNYALPSCRW